MPNRSRRFTPRRQMNEDGFALIEVVVAMAVFTVLASTSVGLLLQSNEVVEQTIRRTAAANLAAEQIESVRTSPAEDISDGTTTLTRTVGTTDFSITRTARYAGSGSASSLCTGSGTALAYKLVTVTVRWPYRSITKSVRSDTLKATTAATAAGTGTLAVRVTDAAKTRPFAAPVTVVSGATTRTVATDEDGCAVITALPTGTYTATATVAGKVGTTDSTTASVGSLVVTSAAVTRGVLTFEDPHTAAVSFDAPAAAAVPTGLSLLISGSYVNALALPICAATVVSACTSAVPGTVRSLYPDVYTVQAGACRGVAISEANVDVRTADGAVVVPVSAATLTVETLTGTPISGRTVTMTRSSGTGCASGETFTTTSVGGGSVVVVPYGTWTFSVAKNNPPTSAVATAAVVANGAAGKSPTVLLKVTS